jgi:hypothetical protein
MAFQFRDVNQVIDAIQNFVRKENEDSIESEERLEKLYQEAISITNTLIASDVLEAIERKSLDGIEEAKKYINEQEKFTSLISKIEWLETWKPIFLSVRNICIPFLLLSVMLSLLSTLTNSELVDALYPTAIVTQAIILQVIAGVVLISNTVYYILASIEKWFTRRLIVKCREYKVLNGNGSRYFNDDSNGSEQEVDLGRYTEDLENEGN